MKKDSFSSIICIFVGLFYLISCLKYSAGTITSPGPALFPRMIGFVMLLCGLLMLLSSFSRREKKDKIDTIWEGLNVKDLLSGVMVIGTIVVYLLILDYIGFLFASSVLVFFLAWIMGGSNWFVNVILGIVSSGLTYWLFWIIMRIPIPLGSLWGR